jgi:Secretion system C-terminal sorting domain
MKTSTYPSALSFSFKAGIAFVITLLISSLQLVFSQVKFTTGALESGTNKEAGAVYRFKSVLPNVDALITIDSLVNGASIVDIDQSGYGFEDAFQPRIQSGGNGVSYGVFTIRFVQANSTTSILLGSITPTNLDLDGNNNLKEFCEFNLNGGTATYMSNSPEIMVSADGSKFMAQNVSGKEYAGIDTAADAVMFKVKRNNVTQFTVRLGATVSNNSQAARQYSVYLKDFEISNAASLPLTLLNFDAILKSEKVNLIWSTTEHKNFSHFVLQRSTDAKNFKDVMTLMTDNTTASSVNQYSYNDIISNVNSSVIYYRLQMVDLDSKYEYSPVRLVRLNASNMVQVQTFPNPVTSELRVTIPSNWQEKNTVYEIYNSNGSLVSRTQVARAVQVQQLNVQSLGSGNYIIRVTNGQEISSSKFIKY